MLWSLPGGLSLQELGWWHLGDRSKEPKPLGPQAATPVGQRCSFAWALGSAVQTAAAEAGIKPSEKPAPRKCCLQSRKPKQCLRASPGLLQLSAVLCPSVPWRFLSDQAGAEQL